MLKIILWIIFTGSIFLTSSRFVNATNTPKFYFVMVFLSVVVIVLAVSLRRLNLNGFLESKMLLWGVYLVCIVQAFYGLCQFFSWLPSNHSKFAITGSFDNPAGFAAILSICFPISLFLLANTKKVARYFAVTGLTIILISIFLSYSRAGILAILISSLVFLLLQTSVIKKIRQFRYYKLLPILVLGLLFIGIFALYNQKKDSADGRLLIWRVSSEMIKDKPIIGHGYDAFKAKYMDYQAEYFKDNPNSKYKLLANNIKHPFNEFIKTSVEFGLIGLTVILSIILFIFWKILKSKNKNSQLVLGGLSSFLVFAFFSYPLHYVAVWLLLSFYLSMILPLKEIKISNTPIRIITKSAIVIACMFFLFHTVGQIRAEIRWKEIAVNSLRGNTAEMLPEYDNLYPTLKSNPFFLYNYGAELSFIGEYDKSIIILTECREQFNDYDLQMLLAENYYKKGEYKKAIQTYQYVSNMIPCRFVPLYQAFEIYKETGQKDKALQYAMEIENKEVKIPSSTVSFIKSEATKYLSDKP